jgi:hypothetical protein
MRNAQMALASAVALGALACATPATAMGGDATEEQGQTRLHSNQPVQTREAAAYGVPEGKLYYAQAPAPGGYIIEAPSGGYVQAPAPAAGAIQPPSGVFTQTLGTIILTPFQIILTPWVALLDPH